MCGVFGFVSTGSKGPSPQRLARLAVETERRGPHAFGFAWIDSLGRLRMFKQTGRISQHLDTLDMLADARMVIGHCRYATQGDPDNNLNNHPHPADGGWLIHNGMIPQYRQIIDDHDLAPVTDCDSEVLSLLIERQGGDLLKRCVRAAQLCEGGPLVLMGLWTRPARMIVVRNGNPLHHGATVRGVYLASLPDGLPDNVQPVDNQSAIAFDSKGNANARPFHLFAPPRRSPSVRSRGDDRLFPVPHDPKPEGMYRERSRRTWGF